MCGEGQDCWRRDGFPPAPPSPSSVPRPSEGHQSEVEEEEDGRRRRRAPSSPLCHLMRGLQHLHEEGVDGRVADQLEEEQVLQALEADGAQRR